MILEGPWYAQVFKTVLALLLFAGFFTFGWRSIKKEWWWERFKK